MRVYNRALNENEIKSVLEKFTQINTKSDQEKGSDSPIEENSPDTDSTFLCKPATLHTDCFGDGSVPSLRTVPVILKNQGKEVAVNALIDEGSTKSFINMSIAELLECSKGHKES